MSTKAVRPSKLGGVLAMLIGISVAVGGVVASVSNGSARHELELLRDSGQRIRGEIIATRYERESHYRRAADHYWLKVRYVHAAAPVVQEVEIPPGSSTRFSMASEAEPMECTVLLDPSRPGRVTLQEVVDAQIDGERDSSLITLLVALGIGVTAMLVGVITYRSAASADRAARRASPGA